MIKNSKSIENSKSNDSSTRNVSSMNIECIDKNMARNEQSVSKDVTWYFPYDSPFRLSGFPYFGDDHIYRRLPLQKKELFESVNPCLNLLSENTAGGQVAFRTNSSKIQIKARNKTGHDMVNMTAVGQCGFDCYIGQNEERLKFYGITRFDITKRNYTCEVVSNLPAGQIRDVLINFPLYDGVEDVMIGLDDGAQVMEPKSYTKSGKVVFYGTSITQGGCATRPGMAYTNILSRWLNQECINFGFSANGLGEYEMAELIADILDVSLVVLDYEANAGTNGKLEASLEEFIRIIREKHPMVPILVISRIQYLADFYDQQLKIRRDQLRKFQEHIVKEKRKKGDFNIYFYNGNDLLDEYFDEYTVDFIHPTDLGFWKMAEGLVSIIRKIYNGGLSC